jgi:phosphoribosylaminoimidazole-succinocarboxamide synthase
VLNQTAAYFLEAAKQICPVHLLCTPDPNVSIGLRCEAYPVEFVVRGYLCGHALRTYQAGGRELCGVPLPEGLRPNDPLPEPILTPTTKSKIGHDIDISEFEILKSGLIPAEEYYQIKHFALALYDQGRRMAAEQGLILADTKYEFGNRDFDIILIDEIHTPDSSRYLLADGYEARQAAGEAQPQLSKEFVREWLLAQGFNGQDDAVAPPVMPDSFVAEVSERYIDVFEQVTGQTFTPRDYTDWQAPMQERVIKALRELGL